MCRCVDVQMYRCVGSTSVRRVNGSQADRDFMNMVWEGQVLVNGITYLLTALPVHLSVHSSSLDSSSSEEQCVTPLRSEGRGWTHFLLSREGRQVLFGVVMFIKNRNKQTNKTNKNRRQSAQP